MTAQQYHIMTSHIRKHPWMMSLIRIANRATTLAVYLIYTVYVLAQLFQQDSRLVETIAVPAVFFVLLSVARDKCNAHRPYEVLDIQPIIQKNTKGHSFPSRHVFSVFIIAAVIAQQVLWLGIVLGIIGVLISVLRVIGGVHFPRDVLAGACIGIACGLLGCQIIYFTVSNTYWRGIIV